MLKGEGYWVITTSDGAETAEIIDQHIPDLIFLDIRMGEKDFVKDGESH